MVGILVFFGIVFIIVLAVKSSKKEETVKKVDVETGKVTIETHIIDEPSAGQTAARITVWIAIGIIGVVVLFGIMILATA